MPHTHKYVAESFSFLPCNYERILFTVIKNDKFRAQQQSRTTQAGKMRQLNGGGGHGIQSGEGEICSSAVHGLNRIHKTRFYDF